MSVREGGEDFVAGAEEGFDFVLVVGLVGLWAGCGCGWGPSERVCYGC